MKEKIAYLETENKTYPIVFNLNVMEEIQEEYGSMQKWAEATDGDGEPSIKDLKNGIIAMINEAIDIENEKAEKKEPLITSKKCGRIISEIGLEKVIETVKKLQTESVKTDGEEKNV